ncbi:MAG: RsmB/NOP family class I SAM-dependent RNA methyltransferase [Candidatus Thorarchaeota archaeon]|nr:MAG: RsmB/NOP family class I SAM-dependent RNA methyltransferase [Candidatus Thorarchaeota archaeon]
MKILGTNWMSMKDLRQKAKPIATEHEYLPYMIERYLVLWGEDATMQFIEACDRPIRTSIRLNTLRAEPEKVIERLQKKGVKLEKIPWLSHGYYANFEGHSTPGAFLEHMLGFYYVQGVPSMTTVDVLDPQPDETVFDLTAAPGGKTTHIAQKMQNSGKVIAIEMDRKRIASLESNILRCGVTNAIVLRGDAKKVGEFGLKPDRILLDAPCSGEGLIPLDPTRKTSKSMADIRFCATRENELLDAAVDVLAPGGTIVYSTCSIAPEENEYIVDDILKRHPEMKVVSIPLEFGTPGYSEPFGVSLNGSLKLAKRFLPHLHGSEGFFICKMIKEEST